MKQLLLTLATLYSALLGLQKEVPVGASPATIARNTFYFQGGLRENGNYYIQYSNASGTLYTVTSTKSEMDTIGNKYIPPPIILSDAIVSSLPPTSTRK